MPVVKAYPVVSMKHGEAVCVAGIRSDGPPKWIRLYPVDFRDLPSGQQFAKYTEIDLEVTQSGDSRPESVKPVTSSIRVGQHLGTQLAWANRWELVEPLLVDSMCDVQRRQQRDGTSLAAFRPEHVDDVLVRSVDPNWSPAQLSALSQLSIFAADKGPLEKVPYQFQYRYSCGPSCRRRNGHTQKIIDWEICEAFRSWRREHNEATTVDLIRQRWLETICADDRDTVFFVGNGRRWTSSFMVLGTFWPPKVPRQRALFQRLADYRHR